MKYTWGYIKDVSLAKLDLDEREATVQNLLGRFPFYANEAMTQICSAVKPKHTFAIFKVYSDKQDRWTELCKLHNCNYAFGITQPLKLTKENEIAFWQDWLNSYFVSEIYDMPNDFISFGDDVNTVKYVNEYGKEITVECFDNDFKYIGDDKLLFFKDGEYNISYNARWFLFTKDLDDDVVLSIPLDVAECIPSYIAHQCYKIDDEVKSSIYRNEYEMLLARLDDTNYKQTKTFMIGGDW